SGQGCIAPALCLSKSCGRINLPKGPPRGPPRPDRPRNALCDFMNCREFEDIVNDLARAKMIDASSSAAGLAHAEICERCASRLADERSLSAGLKSLLAIDEGKAAPDRVEVALLGAFRAQAPNQAARHIPVQSRSWLRWTLAAAALTLIAFG